MEAERPPLVIIDETEDDSFVKAEPLKPLPEGFGYNLDTVAKARQWLTHPQNWFKSTLFIIKWDGLVPRIAEHHGQRLVNEPLDNGLAEVVVTEQRKRRAKKSRGEDLEEKEKVQQDE